MCAYEDDKDDDDVVVVAGVQDKARGADDKDVGRWRRWFCCWRYSATIGCGCWACWLEELEMGGDL